MADSGDDIGGELVFELGNLVFQQQFAPFQPLDLQLIDRAHQLQRIDGIIEIAMFDPEPDQIGFLFFLVGKGIGRLGIGGHAWRAQSMAKGPAHRRQGAKSPEVIVLIRLLKTTYGLIIAVLCGARNPPLIMIVGGCEIGAAHLSFWPEKRKTILSTRVINLSHLSRV